MKRRSFLKNTGKAGLITLITPSSIVYTIRQKGENSLEESFINPPGIARPFTWWHWMNGNITREGITLDLEAMKRVGIGGVQCFNVGTGIPKGPVNYLSPSWIDLTKHAISEAGRLGIEFDMHNCPGWSSTGGSWITPELSMQQFVWSETLLTGGKNIIVQLPKPFVKLDYYQDTYVVAFPALEGESQTLEQLSPTITSNKGQVVASLLNKPDFSTGVDIHPSEDGNPGFLQFEYESPFDARSLTLFCAPVPGGKTSSKLMELQASEDGVTFIKISEVRRAGNNLEMPATVSFPAVKASFFRLVVPLSLHIAGFRLSAAARLINWPSKTNFPGAGSAGTQLNANSSQQPPTTYDVPETSVIDPSRVIDLSSSMDKDGYLHWTAPAGQWMILRIGHTATGRKNNAPPESGAGLECDKYSRTAYDFHFHKIIDALLPSLKAISPNTKVGMLVDSYEVGLQNWTIDLPQEFQKRSGYAIFRYLPAMTGRIVGNTDTTERFLYDLRKTHSDLMADNYHGYFAELCKQHGIISYTEPYNNGPFQQMEVGSCVDINMGEFWIRNPHFNASAKLASSIAHVYGQRVENRQIVGAESFTGESVHSKWQEHPYAMKAQGDMMFTKGVNRFIFHRYAHQPHPTAKPGMTMGPWGFHFDRTNTWFEKGKAWLDYISRCQSLLQQGNFVGDVLYYTGEDVPGDDFSMMYSPEPAPPKGFDYDFINTKALLNRVDINNGRIVLPDGTNYSILVLPQIETMSIEVLRKLRDLVAKGMVLVGYPPSHTPGLANNVSNELELKKLVYEIWGEENIEKTDRLVGRGKVFNNIPLQTVFEKLGISPDFTFSSRSGKAIINYVHRKVNGSDVYFVANRMREREEVVASFRTTGKKPELWHADTGLITAANVYETSSGRTNIALPFEPSGSYFVIFRTPANPVSVIRMEKEGNLVLQSFAFPPKDSGLYTHISNNFTISVWIKPEVEENFSGPYLYNRGIASNVFYPPEGEILYGKGHTACGLVASRNGLAVYERSIGYPTDLQAVLVPISGWTHITLVYKNGIPILYLNGQLVKELKPSANLVHPGLGNEKEDIFSWFFEGDKSEPVLFSEVLSESRIMQLAQKGKPQPAKQQPVQLAENSKSGFLFWENGNYTLHNNKGQNQIIKIEGAGKLAELSTSWEVLFPPNLGAPTKVVLPKLNSLHHNAVDGVKYFSGTATYIKKFKLSANAMILGIRVYLDLGHVEVIAEVKLNGKKLGLLWKPPYRVDITDAIKAGENLLEIEVTNLWPNRLIGDEQLPAENEYVIQGSRGSGIKNLPDWYKEGKPKPEGGRVTFSTWKHFNKESPLLESGLIGPVVIWNAIYRSIK